MADVVTIRHNSRVRIEALTKKGALTIIEYYEPQVKLDVPSDVAEEIKTNLIKLGVTIEEK